jgi:hypothetical protein
LDADTESASGDSIINNVSAIEPIEEQQEDANDFIEVTDAKPFYLESFSNYTNEVLWEHITEIILEGEIVYILPIQDFRFIEGGWHYIFYLVNEENKIIMSKLDNPVTLNERWFVHIEDIHILDLDNDNLDDILIEFSYPVGFGKYAGHVLSTYEIYLQEKLWRGYFYYDTELSRELNETVKDEMRLVNSEAEAHLEYIPDLDFVIDWVREKLADGRIR